MSEQMLTEELLRRAKNGDETARNHLFERYQPRILRIVRMMLGSQLRRRVDSGDIAQGAMLEAVRRLDGFEPRGPGSLLAWFRTIVRSAICAEADRPRPPGPIQSLEPSTTGKPGIDPAGHYTHALEYLERGEECVQLEDCIAELPEADRDLILLRNYAEQSWAEIAAEVGRASANAARVAYDEAKARLAILLQKRMAAGGEQAAS